MIERTNFVDTKHEGMIVKISSFKPNNVLA